MGMRGFALRRNILVLLVAWFACAAFVTKICAQISKPDFKYYGLTINMGAVNDCFYDAGNIEKKTATIFSVWIKCIPDNEFYKISPDQGGASAVVDRAGTKISGNYTPPVAKIEPLTTETRNKYITYEEIANSDLGYNFSKSIHEFNCKKRTYRMKYTSLKTGFGTLNSGGDDGWAPIDPESIGSRLFGILCQKR